MAKPRFKHRYVVVTEMRRVVLPSTFSYRSYAHRWEANEKAGKALRKHAPMGWAYVVDQQNPGSVILP